VSATATQKPPRDPASGANAAAAMPTIRIEKVSKWHADEKVLDRVSLDIPEGVNIGLIGPGGAGKTLLCKIIAGLVEPDEGHVFVNGREVTGMAEIELAKLRFSIGMLFQNYALFDFMNVGENIAFPLRQQGDVAEDEIRRRVAELLDQVDLPGIEHLPINALSGGMKKRVSFARAVIRNPPILVYDDPTAGLDPVTSSKIFIMLEKMKRERGVTSLTISHDLYGMRDVCDRWAMMYKGRLIFEGTRSEIEQAKDERVAEFWKGGMEMP
jgi:phospholipid/cholesterol/gamma-HCH transport system ATP-binding protein